MPTSARSRTFTFTFYPNGSKDAGKATPLAVNPFKPVEIENQYFKGAIKLVHDTGNEPGLSPEQEADKDAERRGLEVQIQGCFKEPIMGRQVVLWAGGELPGVLKLGWITRQVMGLCTQFAKKKTEGRVCVTIGNKTERPLMTFPIGQVLTCIVTPKGNEPPRLGSAELAEVPWKFVEHIEINCDNTYTFLYKTPFLDLCTWELLKVPGVSPMGLENILGEICSSHVFFYDLKKVGTHANWRDGVLLEFFFARGNAGDDWVEEDVPSGAKTPLSDASDPSEASDEYEVDDFLLDNDPENGDNMDDGEASDDTDSSGESIDFDEEELVRGETAVLQKIDGWRPRTKSEDESAEEVIRFPYYIEAIDRRRKKRLIWWCVFAIGEPGGPDVHWNSKAFAELTGFLGKRRRWRTFRRGISAGTHGATRGCATYSVQTLEVFRQAVCARLRERDSRIRRAILFAEPVIQPDGEQSEGDASRVVPRSDTNPGKADDPISNSRTLTEKVGQIRKNFKQGQQKMNPAQLARKFNRGGRKIPLLPPQFFVSNSRACELAFRLASEGKNTAVREGLVGSVQFEGRVCEEFLRLDKSGMLRCFSPYNADTPRVRLSPLDIIGFEEVDGMFLGRFFCFRVSTVLKSFVFCCADSADCTLWMEALKAIDYGAAKAEAKTQKLLGFAQPSGSDLMRFTSVTTRMWQSMPSSSMLLDRTFAQRWRPTKRLVLNDRVLIDEHTPPPSPADVGDMLTQAIQCSPEASPEDLVRFFDLTAQLKGMRFAGKTSNELTAFWVNVYHCLLIHGWLVLGTPKSRRESARFYSRVSYLVGVRPVSLKEIEQVILCIPDMDFIIAGAYPGRVGAERFLGFCCRRRRRPPAMPSSPTGTATPPSARGPPRQEPRLRPVDVEEVAVHVDRNGALEVVREPSNESAHENTPGGPDRGTPPHSAARPLGDQFRCLPIPQLPAAPWRPRRTMPVCLYLGRSPEKLVLPKRDKRLALCLNRGNQSCLPGIIIMDAERLHQQLDMIAESFVKAFVKVVETDGRVVLPHNFRCMTRGYNMDERSLVNFVWEYMPRDTGAAHPPKVARLTYAEYRMDPRERLVLDCDPTAGPQDRTSTRRTPSGGIAPSGSSRDSPPELGQEMPIPNIACRAVQGASGVKEPAS